MRITFEDRCKKLSNTAFIAMVVPLISEDELNWLNDSTAVCRVVSKEDITTIPFTALHWSHLSKCDVYFDFANQEEELLYKLTWG